MVRTVALVESLDIPGGFFGWAMNAWAVAALQNTPRTSTDIPSNFVMPEGRTLAGFPVRVTSQLAGNAGGSPTIPGEAIFGAWSNLIVCFWGDTGAENLVNPYAMDSYRRGSVLIRGFVDFDVVIRRPEAFVYLTNIVL